MHDLEHAERRDARGETGQPHQREADHEREDRTDAGGERERRHVPDGACGGGIRARFGMIADFSPAGTDSTPAVHAPSATKLMWPNESTPELPMKT